MSVPYIEPKTDATLNITVLVAGVPQTDATVTVPRVFAPSGEIVATNLTLNHTANGVYPLSIDKAWSTDASGDGIEGWFIAEVQVVVVSGKQRTRRIRYLVRNAP